MPLSLSFRVTLLVYLLILSIVGRTDAQPGPVPVVQTGHNNGIQCLAFSMDGALLATSGVDQQVLLWDTRSSKMIRTLRGATDIVYGVALSRDGKRLAAVDEGQLLVWNVDSASLLFTMPLDDTRAPWAVAFRPDGKTLAVAWSETRIVDLASHKVVFRAQTPFASSVAWSPNGKRLAVGTNEGRVLLFAPDSRTVTSPRLLNPALAKSSSPINALAFTPDGTRLRWFDPSGKIVSTDSETGAARTTVTVDLGKQSGGKPSFSPSTRYLILANSMALIDADRLRLFNTETGRCLLHADPIGAEVAALPAAEDRIAVAAYDHIEMYDALSGRITARYPNNPTRVNGVVFLPSSPAQGEALKFLSFSFEAHLWDLTETQLTRRFPGGQCQAVSADGSLLVTGVNVSGGPSSVIIQSLDDASLPPQTLMEVPKGYYIKAVAVAPNNNTVYLLTVTGPKQTALEVWDRTAGKRQAIIPLTATTFGMSLSRDGKQLAIDSKTSAGEALLLRDTTDLVRDRFQLPLNAPLIYSNLDRHNLYFSGDGRFLLTQNSEGMDTQTGKRLGPLSAPHGKAIGFLADNVTLITADTVGGGLLLFNAETGNQTGRMEEVEPGRQTVIAGAVHPDGKWLVTCADETEVTLWNLTTKRPALRCIARDSQATEAMGLAALEAGGLGRTPLDYLIVTTDGYYTGTRGAFKEVAFRTGPRSAVPFDDLDLWFNRPDKVLEQIDSSDKERADFRGAAEQRWRRAGYPNGLPSYSTLRRPTLHLVRHVSDVTAVPWVALPIEITPASSPVRQILVTVNDVPVPFSVAGTGISGKAKGKAGFTLPPSATSRIVTLTVPLDTVRPSLIDPSAPNRIVIQVRDEKGATSLRMPLNVACSAPATQQSLYLVAVGVSRYKQAGHNLSFADKDARDLTTCFTERDTSFGVRMGAHFKKIQSLVLTNEEATREKILGVRSLLEQTSPSDVVILFFAGHGLLDAGQTYYFGTYDVAFDHPKERGLAYEEIERLLDDLPARRKLLMMDTCHAGEVDDAVNTDKNGVLPLGTGVVRHGVRGVEDANVSPVRTTRPSFARLQSLFSDFRRGNGVQVIAAAAGAEYAFEQRGNGVFTASVLDGLQADGLYTRADRNKDMAVTVGELRDYVTQQVLAQTGGRQTPTARRESLETDFIIYP